MAEGNTLYENQSKKGGQVFIEGGGSEPTHLYLKLLTKLNVTKTTTTTTTITTNNISEWEMYFVFCITSKLERKNLLCS